MKQPGGLLVGQSHKDGGIKIQTPGGEIEAEGNELITTKGVYESDKIHTLDGKKMTPCEIVSDLNQEEGGVAMPCEIKNQENTNNMKNNNYDKGGSAKGFPQSLIGKALWIKGASNPYGEIIDINVISPDNVKVETQISSGLTKEESYTMEELSDLNKGKKIRGNTELITPKAENGGSMATGRKVRSASEYSKLVREKENIVKNLSPKEIADMWNKESGSVKGGLSEPVNEEWGKRDTAKMYLRDLLIENELTEAEYNKYFSKGGSTMASGEMDDYAIVARTKDNYLFVLTRPVTKKWAQENFKLFTDGLRNGEVGEIMKVSDIRQHKKVIGLEYLIRDIKNQGGQVEENDNCLCKEQLGSKHISSETIVTDKQTNISSKVVSQDEEGLTLKPISAFNSLPEFTVSWDELQEKFKSGEIDISGYEHNDDNNKFLYLVSHPMWHGGKTKKMNHGGITKGYDTTQKYLYGVIDYNGVVNKISDNEYEIVFNKHITTDELNEIQKELEKPLRLFGINVLENSFIISDYDSSTNTMKIKYGDIDERKSKGGVTDGYERGGKASGKGLDIQTLIFKKANFSKQEAIDWAKIHEYSSSKVDEKDKTWRIRQAKPSSFRKNSLRTVPFGTGITSVMGSKKRN